MIIDHFKNWLPKANQVYKVMVEEQNRRQLEQRKKEQRIKIEAEEAKKRVLSTVKI